MRCQIKADGLLFPTMYKSQKVTFPTCSEFCGSGSHFSQLNWTLYRRMNQKLFSWKLSHVPFKWLVSWLQVESQLSEWTSIVFETLNPVTLITIYLKIWQIILFGIFYKIIFRSSRIEIPPISVLRVSDIGKTIPFSDSRW